MACLASVDHPICGNATTGPEQCLLSGCATCAVHSLAGEGARVACVDRYVVTNGGGGGMCIGRWLGGGVVEQCWLSISVPQLLGCVTRARACVFYVFPHWYGGA